MDFEERLKVGPLGAFFMMISSTMVRAIAFYCSDSRRQESGQDRYCRSMTEVGSREIQSEYTESWHVERCIWKMATAAGRGNRRENFNRRNNTHISGTYAIKITNTQEKSSSCGKRLLLKGESKLCDSSRSLVAGPRNNQCRKFDSTLQMKCKHRISNVPTPLGKVCQGIVHSTPRF